jgi:hypothetical protein
MISIQAARRRARQPALEPPLDHTPARLLAMLHDRSGGLTIAAMRERGIEAPAQAIYTLQLAGYEIDRVALQRVDGHTLVGYRLGSRLPASDGTAQEIRDDAP